MLILEALKFHYHDSSGDQVYSFDLSAAPGEIIGLTGRSGSGKSTFLDLIAGFLPPLSGHLRLEDEDFTGQPPGRRPVTILFQNNNLFEHLSVWDNVALGLNTSLRLSSVEEDQVRAALASVALLGMDTRRATSLSGGEQQRVALARSLVADKPVLLLDEPFSALDVETRADMLALVRRIVSERNLVCLMVTHDVRDCDSVADRRYQMIAENGNRHLQEVAPS